MRKSKLFIIIFLLLAVFSLGKGAYAVNAAPHLTFSPSTGSYNNGDTFTVTIGVDSDAENSNAVDVWGTFDSAKLDVVSIAKSSNPVFPFEMQPHYDNTTGKFDFSCSPTEMSNLEIKPIKGELAVITFKAKAAGNASVNFTCSSGSTIDSNIFNATGSDVISCPTNASGSYTINAAVGGNEDSGNTPTGTTATTTSSELPKTGNIGSTVGLIAFGLVSVVGAFFLRFL
jgi:LPXTG-motif cell wall-anchored protein